MRRNPHIGSDVDDFLQEEGFLDAVQAVAVKRVLAHQLEQGMKAKQLTKTVMAKRMGTTRASSTGCSTRTIHPPPWRRS